MAAASIVMGLPALLEADQISLCSLSKRGDAVCERYQVWLARSPIAKNVNIIQNVVLSTFSLLARESYLNAFVVCRKYHSQ